MNLMSRYLARAAIAGSLLALTIILSLELVFAFLDESGDVGRGSYTALRALLYVLASAPQRAYEAFPMATLIGSLMGLGGLAARNELTAMRAAGLSVGQVVRAVLMAGLVLAAMSFVLGEWLAPPSERWAQDVRSVALNNRLATDKGTGFWAREGERFVQVERALSQSRLLGVRLYEFEGGRLDRLVTAAQAEFVDGQWRLEDVRISRIGDDGVTVEQLASLPWVSDLRPDVLEVVVVEPETLPVAALWTYVEYLERNGLESDRYRLAFWEKVVTPLATVTMLLLAVPLVFGSVRSAGAGQRIFIGVLIGIVFFLANRLLSHLGLLYGLPPLLSAILPTLVFMVIGTVAILRVR
jgi:lipopolysaccharide export system permease protein